MQFPVLSIKKDSFKNINLYYDIDNLDLPKFSFLNSHLISFSLKWQKSLADTFEQLIY